MIRKLTFAIAIVSIGISLSLVTPAEPLLADGSGPVDMGVTFDKNYRKASSLIKAEKYAQAVPFLKNFVAENKESADGYNMLAFSIRKLGRIEEALEHYRTALRLDPDHRGAHEYIGEAYLALGQLDKAMEHLNFLDEDCWLGCEEYDDLKEAIAAYRAK